VYHVTSKDSMKATLPNSPSLIVLISLVLLILAAWLVFAPSLGE